MPAIPVYARLEMFLTDQELKDLHALTTELSAQCVSISDDRLYRFMHVVPHLHSATLRAMSERHLLETA